MGTWLNGDGLFVKLGSDEATAGRGGQESRGGPEEVIEFELSPSVLTTSAETILSDVVAIPKGAVITSTQVFILTATAGANANLDIGLVDMDRSSNAAAQALVAAGDGWHAAAAGTSETYILAGTEAGTIYGTALSTAKLVTAGAETATFSSGLIRIRIFYFIP